MYLLFGRPPSQRVGLPFSLRSCWCGTIIELELEMVEVTPARHLCYIVFLKLSIPIVEHSSTGGDEAHMWKSLESGAVEIVARLIPRL